MTSRSKYAASLHSSYVYPADAMGEKYWVSLRENALEIVAGRATWGFPYHVEFEIAIGGDTREHFWSLDRLCPHMPEMHDEWTAVWVRNSVHIFCKNDQDAMVVKLSL